MNDLEQFRQTYISECFDLLADMEDRLLSLQEGEVDKEQLDAIFRCAHSIKGGSGAFGLDDILHFTHVLEALLDAMREGKVPVTRGAVDALLQASDIVSQMVRAANENRSTEPDIGSEVLEQLKRLAGMDEPACEVVAVEDEAETTENTTWEIQFVPHEALFHTGNEPLLILRELSQLGTVALTLNTDRVPTLADIDPTVCYLSWLIQLTTSRSEKDIAEVFEFVEDHCDLTISRMKAPDAAVEKTEVAVADARQPVGQAAKAPKEQAVQAASIRVDIDKVDRLVNMVGELVITEAMLRSQIRLLAMDQFTGLVRGIDELSQHTRELQEAVMAVRMQPVKSVFARMPRIVRDLSAQLGKDIVLEMAGENTEVDKTVIEQLGDPLTHMIRNSVDHGVETPEVRVAAGKPAQGTIKLLAEHRSGRIIIEIRDDGAGINRERVIAKAKEKQIIAPEATLSDEECDNLIFQAGFSTAEKVSNVSGRGVGMDVVKRNIEALGGTVRVTSEPGQGSLFTVSLPLTLAILDGMIVRVGKENYIIPINSIIETLRPKPQDVRSVEGQSDVINVRGEFISLIYLYRLFGIEGAQEETSQALVVLVESGREKIGVMVDELIGQQQVVIKSLEENSDAVAGVSGATILGDGKVSLILDIPGLCRMRWQRHKAGLGRMAA